MLLWGPLPCVAIPRKTWGLLWPFSGNCTRRGQARKTPTHRHHPRVGRNLHPGTTQIETQQQRVISVRACNSHPSWSCKRASVKSNLQIWSKFHFSWTPCSGTTFLTVFKILGCSVLFCSSAGDVHRTALRVCLPDQF